MGKAFYNLDEVRDISILEVCDHFGVQYQKQGRSYFCKLRDEKTASCKLNVDTKYGYDTFKDFGSGKFGDVIAFVQEYLGCDWQTALEELASSFNIQPQNNTDYFRRNELTDKEYEKIGIYGDLATKNFDFDLTTFSVESAEKYAQKYAMSVNELRKKHPNKYLYEVVAKRAFPHINKMRHNYYFSIYTCLSFQKDILGRFDINNVPKEDLDALEKECKGLIHAEALLKKALMGTGYVYPFKKYDVRLDLKKIHCGEISIELGANSYSEIQREVSLQGVFQKYKKDVDLFDYLSLKEYGIDSVQHAAFLKGGKVNLVFMPENSLLIDEIFLRRNVDLLRSECASVLRENYDVNITPNELTANVENVKDLTFYFLTLLSQQSQDLPKNITIPVEALFSDIDDVYEDNDKLTGVLSEYLNDNYNHNNTGFKYEVTYNELDKPASVVVTDVSWKYALSESDILLYSQAALFHDVGKFLIDENIINKPGRLTDEEYKVVKTHPTLGLEVLEKVQGCDERLLAAAKMAAGLHHERVDGRGYPLGLSGNDIPAFVQAIALANTYDALRRESSYTRDGQEIPVFVQAIALADVYDALRSERPYKKSLSHAEAVDMIKAGKCGSFDAEILSCLDKFNPLLMSKYVYAEKSGKETDISKVQELDSASNGLGAGGSGGRDR